MGAKGKGQPGKGKGYVTYSEALLALPPAPAATADAQPTGGATAAGSASATGQPFANGAPIGVPAGGNLTGGWPQMGGQASSSGGAPIDAAAYSAHQAQLRRGEGQT